MLTSFLNLSIKRGITANRVIFFISCYFIFVFNITFLVKSYESVSYLTHYNVFFVLSIPVLLLNLMMLFFSLFSIKYLIKPALIFFTLISALIAYATLHYGVFFDYGMIENALETDKAEMFSYVNVNAV